MARKIFGVIVLVIGGVLLGTGSAVIGMAIKRPPMVILFLVYLVIGMLLTLGGVALWGWRRRRMVFGVQFTVVGSVLLLHVVVLPLMMISKEWETFGGAQVEEVLTMMLPGYALFGVIFLGVGIPLILRERKLDALKAQAEPETPAPPPIP